MKKADLVNMDPKFKVIFNEYRISQLLVKLSYLTQKANKMRGTHLMSAELTIR